jgi:hypothetical protein
MFTIRVPAKRLKVCAAVLGGSALVTIGALSAATADTAQRGEIVVSSGGMSTGETVTVEYSQTLATPVAVPPVKATFFGESG